MKPTFGLCEQRVLSWEVTQGIGQGRGVIRMRMGAGRDCRDSVL